MSAETTSSVDDHVRGEGSLCVKVAGAGVEGPCSPPLPLPQSPTCRSTKSTQNLASMPQCPIISCVANAEDYKMTHTLSIVANYGHLYYALAGLFV
jgi:hypothetical protein